MQTTDILMRIWINVDPSEEHLSDGSKLKFKRLCEDYIEAWDEEFPEEDG